MPGDRARLPAVDRAVHEVEFYSDDGELAASAGGFLGEGLAAGCPAVAVATPAHRAAFGVNLGVWATEGGAAEAAGRLVMVDAAAMLQGFVTDGRLDPARFRDAATDLIGRVARPGQPARVYADMMALLWDAGQVRVALELEALWDGLAADLQFSLLCGYPARLMTQQDTEKAVEEMCQLHSTVVSSHPPATATGPLSGPRAVRSFPPAPGSARQARRFVLGLLDREAAQEAAADAAIITAELAANAVLHARTGFTVAVSYPPGRVRISVSDAAPMEPGQLLPVRAGHGLDVVAQVAVRWTVQPRPGGKVVWAELPAAPQEQGTQ